MRLISLMKYKRIDKSIPAFKQSAGDAGVDLYTLKDQWVWPFRTTKVNTNIAIELGQGEWGRVTSRSGMSLKNVTVIPGTIDETYRGTIAAIVHKIGLFPKFIPKGTRICQLIIMPYKEIVGDEVEELTDTARGINGFGHSGEN
jgi:dUTP pyrophosphatase